MGKLREDVSRLRELLSLQGKVTGGTVPKQSSVEAAAKYLNKYAGAKADVKELSGMLTDFYKFLATDKDYSWEDVQQRAMVIARYLQDNVQLKPQLSDYARDVIRAVRGISITLDKSQRAEKAKIDALAKAYEDIKNSSDPALQDAYSDAVSQYLFTLEANVGDTRLGDMTLDQIGDFYFFTITYSLFTKSYRRFLKVIRNSE